MRLRTASLYDLLYLANDARADEREQWEALTGRPWDVEEVANDHYNRGGLKFTLVDAVGSPPIAAGGWQELIPGVWQSWMIGTADNWATRWRAITKASRRVMDDLEQNLGARRLQTSALASRALACAWYVRGLKMQPEGIMRGFGMGGEDVAMFARVKEQARG